MGCAFNFCAEDNAVPEAADDRTPVKPSFSSVIKDVEVVEGSAARFECKIDGKALQTLLSMPHTLVE